MDKWPECGSHVQLLKSRGSHKVQRYLRIRYTETGQRMKLPIFWILVQYAYTGYAETVKEEQSPWTRIPNGTHASKPFGTYDLDERMKRILIPYQRKIKINTAAAVIKLETIMSSIKTISFEINELKSSREVYNSEKASKARSVESTLSEDGQIAELLDKITLSLDLILKVFTNRTENSPVSKLIAIFALVHSKTNILKKIIDTDNFPANTSLFNHYTEENNDEVVSNGKCTSNCNGLCLAANVSTTTTTETPLTLLDSLDECRDDTECFERYQTQKPFCVYDSCVEYCSYDMQCKSVYGSSWVCKMDDTDYGYCAENLSTTPVDECYYDLDCFKLHLYDRPFCDTVSGSRSCVNHCKNDEQCMVLHGPSWICQNYGFDYGYCADVL